MHADKVAIVCSLANYNDTATFTCMVVYTVMILVHCNTCKHATSFSTGIILCLIIIIALCSGWNMIDLVAVKTVAQRVLFTTMIL